MKKLIGIILGVTAVAFVGCSGDSSVISEEDSVPLSSQSEGTGQNFSSGDEVSSSSIYVENSENSSSSISEGMSSGKIVLTSLGDSGVFIDPRDNRAYKYRKYETLTWMTENLTWSPTGSVAGDEALGVYTAFSGKWAFNYDYAADDGSLMPADSITNGFFYDFASAQTACPPGWHLPDSLDYTLLFHLYNQIDPMGSMGEWESPVSKYLKSSEGWPSGYPGYNVGGFNVYPATWQGGGDSTKLWVNEPLENDSARILKLTKFEYSYFSRDKKSEPLSVRCVANGEIEELECGKENITHVTAYTGVRPGVLNYTNPANVVLTMTECTEETLILQAPIISCGCFATVNGVDYNQVKYQEVPFSGGKFQLYSNCNLSCR